MTARIFLLLLSLIFLLVGSAFAAQNDHPLLAAMGIDTSAEEGTLYVVRSAVPVPQSAAYRILGTHRDLSIISGDPAAVESLRNLGFVVGELGDAPPAALSARSIPVAPPVSAIPTIQDLVYQVNWASLEEKIIWLTDFGTRNSYTPECAAAAESLQVYFADLGLQSELEPFVYNQTTMYNVVASQIGTTQPDSVVIICGHYDSTSPSNMTNAPGADDNGTGTAVVMHCAEILSPYDFKYTIQYVCFSGEEQYLRGSAAFAGAAADAGANIVAVLNYDMIGYGDVGVELDLEIETNNASIWLANVVTAAIDLYTNSAYELHVDDGAWWGDHYSFWRNGFPALNNEESWDWGDPDFNPYYHSVNDVIDHVHPGFMEDNGRIAVASLATLAGFQESVGVPEAPLKMDISASPNPFNGRVRFRVEGVEFGATVDLEIFDVRGRRVRALRAESSDGIAIADWDGSDGQGQPLGSGGYFCRMQGGNSPAGVRVVYVK